MIILAESIPGNDKHRDEEGWMQSEKKNYYDLGDQDGDKKLNRKELGDWLLNPNIDYIEDEVRHLIEEADANKV